MVRFCVPVGLMLAHLVLSDCSNRQQLDLTQWREYDPTTAEEPSRPVKASVDPSQARSRQATDADPKVGTVGRATGITDVPKHLRPWPKQGTPEFEQLQAEEIERENRAKAAIHSICRGC